MYGKQYVLVRRMETLREDRPTRAKSLTHRVHHVRRLTDSTFVLRVDRHNLVFEPGQYINVGLKGTIAMREYSVYSGSGEDFLEILVKEVEGGLVSKALARLKEGDPVALDGPFGFFTIDAEERERGKFLFVATGTGISPFHCFAKSLPGLDYRLLHGVRTSGEQYDQAVFEGDRYLPCVSREQGAAASGYSGRVTTYLKEHPVDGASLCYLCGNCDMIYEVFDILRSQGVPANHLFAEVYF